VKELSVVFLRSKIAFETLKISVFNPKTGWVTVGFFQKISGSGWVWLSKFRVKVGLIF
jgi:hypothetical protein